MHESNRTTDRTALAVLPRIDPGCNAGGLAEPPSDVILGLTEPGPGKNRRGFSHLDKPTEIHKGGVIADSRGLLHVVRDDQNRVLPTQSVDQVLDFASGDRIERRTRLIEQQNLGVAGNRPGDAQPLLLPPRETQPRFTEPVLDLLP